MHVVPALEDAPRDLVGDQMEAFMQQISRLEAALAKTLLDVMAARTQREVLVLREYDDTLAADFRDINVEWISTMFQLEAVGREVLEHHFQRPPKPAGCGAAATGSAIDAPCRRRARPTRRRAS